MSTFTSPRLEATSKDFEAVNKAISELIPIEQAYIRRIPIDQRRQFLNLTDIIGLTAGAFDPRTLTVPFVQRLMRSGTLARYLMDAARKLGDEPVGNKLTPAFRKPRLPVGAVATQQKALGDVLDRARPKGDPLLGVNEQMSSVAEIKSWVKEFFGIEPKVEISEPTITLIFGDARLTRQQTKHIVEQRMAQGKTIEEINSIFERLPEVVKNSTLEYPNTSLKYPNSFRRARFYPELNKGVVVILDNKTGEIHDVITAFTNRIEEFMRLQRKYKK